GEFTASLVPEPEPEASESIVDPEPLADEAAGHDHGERAEEDEHAAALSWRLRAADERCEEEAARDPCGGDPEDGELEMPGPEEVVRKPAGEIEAVECSRLHAVVRKRPAGEGLEEEEHRHHREEEPGGPLTRRELPRDEPVVVRVSGALLPSPPEIVELAEREQNEPERAEQRDQAEPAPQIRRRGRHVARPRFVRPVVRIRVVLARP